MNPFDEIESYIIDRVAEVDPTLQLRPDPFGEEDIASITAERYFKFWFTNTDLGREGSTYTEEVNGVLQIYAKRTRDVNQSFKDVYCKGLDIKNAIVDPMDAKEQTFMTDVFAQISEPTPLETDDNTITVTLNLLFRRDLSFF